MRILIATLLMALSKSVLACSCGWGEYFYPMSKLEGNPEESSEFYQKNYGVNDLNSIKAPLLKPKIEDTFGFMVINLPIPDGHKGNDIHLVLESKVAIEDEEYKGFNDQALFQKVVINPNEEVSEVSTRMESKGNEWSLYILIVNKKGKIIALAKHTGKDTCAKDVYVKSIERAKYLDSQRKSGCYQTWVKNTHNKSLKEVDALKRAP